MHIYVHGRCVCRYVCKCTCVIWLHSYMCYACIVSYNCMYQVLNMCIRTFKFMLCVMGTPSLVMLMVRCCTGVEGFQVKISCQNSCAIEESFCRDSHIYFILYLQPFTKICVSLKLLRLNSYVIIQISVFTYQKLVTIAIASYVAKLWGLQYT